MKSNTYSNQEKIILNTLKKLYLFRTTPGIYFYEAFSRITTKKEKATATKRHKLIV